MPASKLPTAASIASELQRLIARRGLPRFSASSILLGLDVVMDRAGSDALDAREAALAQLLPQLAREMASPAEAEAVIALLSLSGTLVDRSVGVRRNAAGQHLGRIKGESVRRRYEPALIERLARSILSAEVAFRRRHREIDATNIDWEGRLVSYGRMYTPLAQLGNDLDVLVRVQRERPDEPALLHNHVASSLWGYARFQIELDRFTEAFGGIWLFSSIDVENDVANAMFHLNRHPAVRERELSWLRGFASHTHRRELDPFLNDLAAGAQGQDILQTWETWCRSCSCDSVEIPIRDCEVHAVILAAFDYCDDIDEELLGLLGEPIRHRLRDVPTEHIGDLIKRFGLMRSR